MPQLRLELASHQRIASVNRVLTDTQTSSPLFPILRDDIVKPRQEFASCSGNVPRHLVTVSLVGRKNVSCIIDASL